MVHLKLKEQKDFVVINTEGQAVTFVYVDGTKVGFVLQDST